MPRLSHIHLFMFATTCVVSAVERDYPFPALPVSRVTLAKDNFWTPRLATNRTVTIWHDFKECEETGRIANFEKAAGLKKGYFEGFRFNDSDVYKVIEGASYILAEGPDPKLDTYLDNLIGIIAKAQQLDGYLYTARTVPIDPARPVKGLGEARWHEQESHELYCAGHLYEAAVAHFEATGERTLLNVATKNADLVTATFGPDKLRMPPGHQEIEMALVRLHRATGNPKYLELAAFFLDERGHSHNGRKLWGAYFQDAVPIREQTEAIGHSVRAAYQYMGMADVAALTGDEPYIDVLKKLWNNVAEKKLYLTGGIGGGAGEGFSGEYDLPNLGAYNETCSSIANILWQQRMFQLTGEAKYVDVLERCLFNSFLSGVSIAGDRFFYPNKLCSVVGANRTPWFPCACCPPNVVRFIPQIPGLFYATKPGEIFVNLYGPGTSQVPLDGTDVQVRQTGNYPWSGRVRIELNPAAAKEFTCHLRIPGWLSAPLPSELYRYADTEGPTASLKVNGETQPLTTTNGYASIEREWKPGDVIELAFPMPIRHVVADDKVAACRGLVAIMRGPLVYCAEGPDNDRSVHNRIVSENTRLTPEWHPDLLGGITSLTGSAEKVEWNPDGTVKTESGPLTLIPYFAWANRGNQPMRVWLPTSSRSAWPAPTETIASKSKVTSSAKVRWSSLDAVNDQILPVNSSDRESPRFAWTDTGVKTDSDIGERTQKSSPNDQWIQYDFPTPETVSSVGVYWATDQEGRLRVPRSARILVMKDGKWEPVSGSMDTPEPDQMNILKFTPIETKSIRLEVTSTSKHPSGILEWWVR